MYSSRCRLSMRSSLVPVEARKRARIIAPLFTSVCCVFVAILGGWALAGAAGRSESDASKAEAELQAVRSEIDRISKQVNEDQVQRDRISRELKSAEVSVGKAREGLDDVRRERASRASKRSTLAAARRTRQADLAQNRAALAGQLRAAYLIGREEPLKFLLNQQDPERAGRMFVYYSYFGRARAEQIHQIEGDVEAITQLDGQVAAEDEQLAALEKQQRAELMNLELAREKRSGVLASLTAESNSHVQNLEKLKEQQGGLEKLIRELRRAVEKFPTDNNDAFA